MKTAWTSLLSITLRYWKQKSTVCRSGQCEQFLNKLSVRVAASAFAVISHHSSSKSVEIIRGMTSVGMASSALTEAVTPSDSSLHGFLSNSYAI